MLLVTSSEPAVADVRATLQTFQDGYTHRDTTALDTFMGLFAPDATLEVIGTSASARTEDERCVGHAAVRDLVAADWQFWGDLLLDVAGAHIHVHGSVAWLATTGTVTQTIALAQRYTNITDYLRRVMDRGTDVDVERELLLVILGAASALANARDGEQYSWPIRFTAVLIQQQAHWQFHQIHFSFPTIHDPDVRLA
jgi:ketosteroid isomerase-like protein